MRFAPSDSEAAAPTSPVLLARGFRVFFLLAGLYAVVSIGAWVALFRGWAVFPTSVSPAFWHGHEMVFGYAIAAVTGFLLTAVPNWTGTAPVQGAALAALAALWLAGRIAVWVGPLLPAALAAAVDLAYLPVLAVMMARVLWPARKPKNFAFVGVLTLLFLANLSCYVPLLGQDETHGLLFAVDLLIVMIAIVGGRITPSFTANALRLQPEAPPVTTRPWLERVAVLSVLALAFADGAGLPAPVTGSLALIAGAANTARLAGYRSLYTWRNPILWSLHLGYAWVCLGLVLKGVSAFVPSWPQTAALHALTAGGIGTMTLAVMSRASLGHTGRPMTAPLPVVWAFGAVSLAAAIRVVVPIAFPAYYVNGIAVSGAIWVAAFGLFLYAYWPILTRPRVDGQPG